MYTHGTPCMPDPSLIICSSCPMILVGADGQDPGCTERGIQQRSLAPHRMGYKVYVRVRYKRSTVGVLVEYRWSTGGVPV